MTVRHFGKFRSPLAVPSLTDIQTVSWLEFLQEDVPFNRRTALGLESILRETFPIYSFDKTVSLEYVGYELGRPRYTADECRTLGVSFGMPFTSAEQEPHFPALQFQRQARSFAWVAWMSWTASSTTIPSETSVA